MLGELKVQLRNELQFVELSEVCSVNKQLAQLRIGFTNVSYWANIICSVLKVKLFRHVEDIIIITNSAVDSDTRVHRVGETKFMYFAMTFKGNFFLFNAFTKTNLKTK